MFFFLNTELINLNYQSIINTIINVFNFITNKYQNNNLQELEEIQNEINEQSILLYNQLRERIEHNDTLHNERIEQYVNEILRQEEIRRLQREEEIRNLRLQSRLQSIIRHNQSQIRQDLDRTQSKNQLRIRVILFSSNFLVNNQTKLV